MWVGLLIMVVIGVVAIASLQFRAQRSTYKPLASRQPARRQSDVPLGMEATDLDAVSRTNRRNESLERGQTNWLTAKGFFGRADTEVAPLADDETYAARFHTAFHTTKSKD
ncbi:hypothetical protein OS190_10665 [Sulfitobacter sp. F26204]|uniref:hypothetical protein n=1 Tax=Sulfitobacter sp. F26204 TaxID=2996014 RepID=UPI00225E62C5|nr:hypothetical protein [Sulfitobacter sp. F26204]MCX7560029.1 hypothetical protein [Sulfitobacter sp. F26204]